MDKGPHQKRWMVVANNYSEDDYAMLRGLFESGVATYVILGREVGASGTPHIQGYVEFAVKKRFSAVRASVAN